MKKKCSNQHSFPIPDIWTWWFDDNTEKLVPNSNLDVIRGDAIPVVKTIHE